METQLPGAPSLSVIVPAYRAEATLGRCVEAILGQRTDAAFEVIVVASADTAATLPRLTPDDRLRVIEHVPRVSAAAARNLGVREATGAALAFTDADVVVPATWLDALVAASDGLTSVVAGSVENGTPDSAAGTSEYLVQFLDLVPGRPVASVDHGATCNLLVPRARWRDYGPFPEDLGGGEDTLLTQAAHRDGRLIFAPEAAVVHLNRTTVRAVLGHQWEFGRFTARLARRSPELRYGWLQRSPLLAPVAVIARLVSLAWRSTAWLPGQSGRLVKLSPLLAAALVAWGAGLAAEGVLLRRAGGPPRP
jgi:glycosyltransferase involved in cell wall biosynthesis